MRTTNQTRIDGDSAARHTSRGAQWPADPALPSYPVHNTTNPRGAPPAVARRHQTETELWSRSNSGTSVPVQGKWTPSSWTTQADPTPICISASGGRHSHALESDGLYRFKRLDHVPISPFDACQDNDWGLNPYDANTPFLREYHAWAHAQGQLVREHGYEGGGNVRADRQPGLSTVMARSSPDVSGLLRLAPRLTPSQLDAARDTQRWDSGESTSATIQKIKLGFPPVAKSQYGLAGDTGSWMRARVHHERADVLAPTQRSVAPAHVFH